MTAPHQGGASIDARTRSPSVDLAKLAELLAKALDPSNPAAKAIFSCSGSRLVINSSTALRALFGTTGFKEALSGQRDDTRFVREIDIPPIGTKARVGGRLVPGSEGKTTAAIEKLHRVVSAQLDIALSSSTSPAALVAPSAELVLQSLAGQLDVKLPEPPPSAGIVPVGFPPSSRSVADRSRDVARLLSAIELVEGDDWLEGIVKGIQNKLSHDDWDDDEIAPLLKSLRAQKDRAGSQIRRFLDFLDDEALSRVRLQIGFRLMQSISTRGNDPLLASYVANVLGCFNLFGSTAGRTLMLDGSFVFGQRNNCELSELLRQAGFYGCLPVWAEWSAQLFEARISSAQRVATKREVSYRFRINGQNPATSRPAFNSRLDRLEHNLLSEERRGGYLVRSIGELFFLALVIPSADAENTDLQSRALALAAEFKKSPEETVRALLTELRTREDVVERIARNLIKILQVKSNKLIDEANRGVSKFYIALHRGIIDWPALESMASSDTEVLAKQESGNDKIAWFQHVTVTDNPAEVGALVSFPVRTKLIERSISPEGTRREVRMTRKLDCPVLPIQVTPLTSRRGQDGRPVMEVADATAERFDIGIGVRLLYDAASLTLKPAKNDEKPQKEQLRAAACTAFALFSYLALWELISRLKKLEGLGELAAHLIRLQTKGKDTEPEEGTSAVYAACQAIERALCRELLVKMQGFNTQGETKTLRFRKLNTLLALQGGFPVHAQIEGMLDRLAVVSYVTRPCDTHPDNPDADGYLFVSRTFKAVREGVAMTVSVDQMQSRLVETKKSFREPQLILEEIARLRQDGFAHIVLLSHHFGNRHLGRAAERHSPHSTQEFLDSVAAKFPDISVYSLRRDVFPATRLHTRAPAESAFEVSTFAAHKQMYEQSEHDLLRGLHPIYTFATLAVVSESGRPQSGFCTYFFDIEQRLSDLEWGERIRQNILGFTPEGKGVRDTILGVLRTIHYLESERAATSKQLLPVLDPYGWVSPLTTAAAGELRIMERRKRGDVLLSMSAVLAHVTKVLHRRGERKQ